MLQEAETGFRNAYVYRLTLFQRHDELSERDHTHPGHRCHVCPVDADKVRSCLAPKDACEYLKVGRLLFHFDVAFVVISPL